MRPMRRFAILVIAAIAVALTAILALERGVLGGVRTEELTLAGSPATLYRPAGGPAPLVLVAHGFAGSRQMMRPLSIALARAGFAALAFDFHGHGRHPVPMDGDVTSLDGATAQLVAQAVAVGEAARALPGLAGPLSVMGHSMATDVVVRAAPLLDAAAVVAISMYSEAVTPDAPARLLIVSGASEGRLREVALEAVRLVDPAAAEGITARAGGAARRAVAAPLVGHVGVLYVPFTMTEARDWIAAATGRVPAGPAPGPDYALWLLALLAATALLAWPAARLAGPGAPVPPARLSARTLAIALLAPVPAALAAAVLLPAGALGLSAFGQLAGFLAAWGVVQGAVLWRAGCRPAPPGWGAGAVYLGWALLFAAALDRYGASFVPAGPRAAVAALMLLGTLPYLASDALLARGAGLPWRIASRALALAALLGAMLIEPRMGTAFTVLPVAVLFWLVYGLGARPFREKGGAAIPLGLALVLAWAIAASTPLIAA